MHGLLNGDSRPEGGATTALAAEGRLTETTEALSLDGVSGAAVTEADTPVDTTASFTVAAWVSLRDNPGLLGDPEYAAAVSQIGSVAGAFLLGVREGSWDFTMKREDSNEPGSSISVPGPPAKADGRTWVHIAGVHDAESQEIRLYLDGAPIGEVPFDEPWSAEGPLTIGRALVHSSSGNFWTGAIGDVRVYQAALDEKAVVEAMAVDKPSKPPPPAPPVSQAVRALDGVYVYDMTPAESQKLEDLFGSEAAAAGFPGRASVVQRFSAGAWQQYYLVDGKPYLLNGNPEGDAGSADVQGHTLTLDNGTGATDYRWRLQDDVLSLRLQNPHPDPVVGFVMEHDYVRATD